MVSFLTLVIFLLAVYGLANAIAVLKIGCHIFGDPADELVLENGAKIVWKSLTDRGDSVEIQDCKGQKATFLRSDVRKILRRKGLGRIPYLGELFYCPACLSFWIGIAASLWIVSPAVQVCPIPWKAALLDGFTACAASWLLHAAAMKMLQGVEDV